MKRLLLLTAMAGAVTGSVGCVLTDYPAIGVSNKSHGIIDCRTDDRIANSQQTLEPGTRELLYTAGCSGANPLVTLQNVSAQDARDWNRFVGTHSFFGEAGVTGDPSTDGMYILGSVKDLADGSVRLNTYFGPNPNVLSCVGAAVDGRYGAPEGVIMGDHFGRQPGLRVDAVAIDRTGATPTEFCTNLVAISADRGASSFSTYWSQNVRAYEGRLEATPITRREGLASFLGGGTLTTTIEGVTMTLRGELQADGSVAASLLSASHDGVTYEAASPIRIVADPHRPGRTSRTEVTPSELVRLGQFALDAGLTDRKFDLAGGFVPELGMRLPDAALLVSGERVREYIADHSAPVDGN